ncbi:MAG: hypothetical protein V1748_09255 [Actinomycetota bacterium]
METCRITKRKGFKIRAIAATVIVVVILVLLMSPLPSQAAVFMPIDQLTAATGTNSQLNPEIAVDSRGKIHIAWAGIHPTDGGAQQIWYADNTSGAWSTTQLTAATSGNDQVSPEMEVDSNRKSHITWGGSPPD